MTAIKKKICFATGTRADWGLLSQLAKTLDQREDCDVTVIATNMHLSERYGMTVNDIIADGFTPMSVEMNIDDDSETARAEAMGECMKGFAIAFAEIKPNMLVILGDRYEMLAVASTAAVMRIPIVHIAGGTISEGAVDDSIRHAITKLSALHFTETEQYRHRVIAMGENPDRVINTGAIGVWNICNMKLMDKSELSDSLGFDLSTPYAIATFHPATLDDVDPGESCREMLKALDKFAELNVIITYPNNDARSEGIIREIKNYAQKNPKRVLLIKSLGYKRYLSALKYAEFEIGNSSSGIVEVASFGIPAIDIGIRQNGRDCAESVIHCADSEAAIEQAISKAMSSEFKKFAAECENPYNKPNTLKLMTEAIVKANPEELIRKKFYDIEC